MMYMLKLWRPLGVLVLRSVKKVCALRGPMVVGILACGVELEIIC